MSQLVHIVDDDAPFRLAVSRLLRLQGYDVAEYQSADQFLEHVRQGIKVGCVLLDVSLPGLSGPDLQVRLAKSGSQFPIVFLTSYSDARTIVQAIKAGAEDFLIKPVCEQALLDSIRGAFAHYDAQLAKHEWQRRASFLLNSLTPREREVLDHVVHGKMNKETAHSLGITERTIKAHRQQIADKLGAKSASDLVLIAERLGLLADNY